MTPKEFIERLQAVAQDARHHPEPAVAVSLLAQLLLDLAVELEPMVDKFNLVLKASGFPGALEGTVAQVQQDLTASGGAYDPRLDTTGTAG